MQRKAHVRTAVFHGGRDHGVFPSGLFADDLSRTLCIRRKLAIVSRN
jgi:hypothetical protein